MLFFMELVLYSNGKQLARNSKLYVSLKADIRFLDQLAVTDGIFEIFMTYVRIEFIDLFLFFFPFAFFLFFF